MKKLLFISLSLLGSSVGFSQALDSLKLDAFKSPGIKYKSGFFYGNLVGPVVGRNGADTSSKVPGTIKQINDELWTVDRAGHWVKAVKATSSGGAIDSSLFATKTNLATAVDTTNKLATKTYVATAVAEVSSGSASVDTLTKIATKHDIEALTSGVPLDTSVFMNKSRNLADVADPAAARANLGISGTSSAGTLSTKDYLVWDDFSRANSSSLGVAGSGQAYEFVTGGPVTSQIINNRWVTGVTAINVAAACSGSIDTQDTVAVIGAKFKWTGGNDVYSDGLFSMYSGLYGGDNVGYNGIQVNFSRSFLTIIIHTLGATDVSQNLFYGFTLPRDKDVSVELSFIGNTMYYTIGTFTGSYTHEKIRTQRGNTATWQTYYSSIDGTNFSQGISVAALWVGTPKYLGVNKTLYARDATKRTVTGTTNKTAVFRQMIKKNTLGVNGNLRLEWLTSWTSSTNIKRVEIEIGGVQIGWLETNNNAGWKGSTVFQNRGALNVGVAPMWANNMAATGPVNISAYDAASFREINFGADQELIIYITLIDPAETASVETVQLYTFY